jgi:hypothetical protein
MSIPVGITKTISCQNFNTDFNVLIFLLFYLFITILILTFYIFNYPLRCRAVLPFRGDTFSTTLSPLAANGMAAWRSGGIYALPFKSALPAAVAPNRSLYVRSFIENVVRSITLSACTSLSVRYSIPLLCRLVLRFRYSTQFHYFVGLVLHCRYGSQFCCIVGLYSIVGTVLNSTTLSGLYSIVGTVLKSSALSACTPLSV